MSGDRSLIEKVASIATKNTDAIRAVAVVLDSHQNQINEISRWRTKEIRSMSDKGRKTTALGFVFWLAVLVICAWFLNNDMAHTRRQTELLELIAAQTGATPTEAESAAGAAVAPGEAEDGR